MPTTTEHYWYLVAKYWYDPSSLSVFDIRQIEWYQQFGQCPTLDQRKRHDQTRAS